MMTKSLVICHFYNEEYLLPYWLRHHLQIFDHGVMINNGSNDGSVAIIKNLAPHWTIIESGLQSFDALMLDFIVQKEEEKFSGWKICLNVSEYLVGDLKSFISNEQNSKLRAVELKPYIMFDPSSNVELDPSRSLIEQKPFGFYDNGLYDFIMRDQKLRKILLFCLARQGSYKRRARLLHSHKIGGYTLGRHNWHHKSQKVEELRMFWYGFSPNTTTFINRKISFGATLPKDNSSAGAHHKISRHKYKWQYFWHRIFFAVFGKHLVM